MLHTLQELAMISLCILSQLCKSSGFTLCLSFRSGCLEKLQVDAAVVVSNICDFYSLSPAGVFTYVFYIHSFHINIDVFNNFP